MQLDDAAVSRYHAEIVLLAGVYRLRDLGSRHGTFVFGEPVRERVLAPGDSIQIGASLLVFSLGEEPLAEPPAGGPDHSTQHERPPGLAWLPPGEGDPAQRHGLIGESPPMVRLRALIDKLAAVDSTVLLRGESGSGKELVARALHQGSRRAAGAFVAVNCATLSETLLESELFGHERGAFTGAQNRKLGKFELASGGTIFLDEVAEIPVQLQAKLLRALQERQIERVGGERPIAVDVRLLAATHRDLEAAIAAGAFRADLFYRLNVVTLALPPLRERPDDIVLLARFFAREQGKHLMRPVLGFTTEAQAALAAYDWPGNVRQLANVVERAVVLGDGEWIRAEDLPEEVLAASPQPSSLDSSLSQAKKDLILAAWRESGGDLGRAAESSASTSTRSTG